jgi:hypothetical protein
VQSGRIWRLSTISSSQRCSLLGSCKLSWALHHCLLLTQWARRPLPNLQAFFSCQEPDLFCQWFCRYPQPHHNGHTKQKFQPFACFSHRNFEVFRSAWRRHSHQSWQMPFQRCWSWTCLERFQRWASKVFNVGSAPRILQLLWVSIKSKNLEYLSNSLPHNE